MKRGWSVFWVSLMIAVAVITYAMKDSAGRAADRVMQLRADIAHEKDQLNVLRAEWGVLDQPSRLQSLVARYNSYLDLKSLDVRQLATIADVPAKPPGSSETTVDGIRTGSIAVPAKPKIDKPVAPKRRVLTETPTSAPKASTPKAPASKAAPTTAIIAKSDAPKAAGRAAPAEPETGFLQ